MDTWSNNQIWQRQSWDHWKWFYQIARSFLQTYIILLVILMKFSLFLRKDLPAFRFTVFTSIIINLNFAIIHFMHSETEKTGFQIKILQTYMISIP